MFISGLDLGQTSDPTALATLSRDDAAPATYTLHVLQRFQLGTSYPAIVDATAEMFSRPGLAGSILMVDETGVGRPVCDMFRARAMPCAVLPVTITAGHRASREDDGSFHVPKKELVGALQILFQTHRIKIPASIPEVPMLVKELQNFTVKITKAANEVFSAWREGLHDDLVLALAMAAWFGERAAWGPNAVTVQKPGGRSFVEDAPEGVFLS